MADSLERCERALLESLGTLDPASEVFAARVAEFERLASALPRDRDGLERVLALNALLQDAVRRERDGVGQQIEQLRLARESLRQALQPLETGDSCDVRG